jgi:VWFA-related protein
VRPIASLLALVAALGLQALHAQDVQEREASAQTFKASTRLIQVSVVVHDGNRRPVTGLRAEDFEILEDGKPQPVSLFAVTAGAPTDTAAAAAGVFTNRLQSPSSGGVVAIVFDRLNTSFSEQMQARAHIIKYLGEIRPGDRVALFVLGEYGLRILHDFSKDAGSLLRAIQRAQASDSTALAGSQAMPPDALGFVDQMEAELSAFARGNLANMRAHYARVLAYTSLEALEDVAAYLSGIPGRKNLIWVSSGFPFSITEYGLGGTSNVTFMSPETRRATRALNTSDVAVYPVDARGLVGAFASHPSAPMQEFSTISTVMGPIDGLRHVADWTGGRAFYNTNDLGTAIHRAVGDSEQTYILGYYPSDQAWDEKFRKIKVKVQRRGVEVRHRSGYYALPPEPPDTNTRQKAIIDALGSPLEATSLPINVTVTPAEGGRLTLTIQLEPSVPTLVKENGAWVGAVDVAIAQTLPTGQHTKEADVTLPFSLTDGERDRLLKDGLRVTRTIDLRPDAHQVRVVARDAMSGTTGSVIITVSQIDRRERRKTLVQTGAK